MVAKRQKADAAADALTALRSAIADLPRGDQPPLTENQQDRFVRSLMVEGGPQAKRERRRGPERARKDLRQLAAVYRRELDLLNTLDGSAAAAFSPAGLSRAKTVAHAMMLVSEAAANGDLPLNKPQSRRASGPQQLALNAGYVFLVTTGRQPARTTKDGRAGGPFMDFLARVFAARGVAGSPESNARWAIKAMEVRHKK